MAGFDVLRGSHDGITKLMVNHRKEPFSDARFRQALYYAIDRQALVDTVLRGYGIIASPGLLAHDNDLCNPNVETYDYDPARAGSFWKSWATPRTASTSPKTVSPWKWRCWSRPLTSEQER